jgi:hypothetical protein
MLLILYSVYDSTVDVFAERRNLKLSPFTWFSVPDCVTFPMSPFLFIIDQEDSLNHNTSIVKFFKISVL